MACGRQFEDCERLAERQGWEVVERYVDDDVSAYNGRVRPAYRRMLDDLAGGHRTLWLSGTSIACTGSRRSLEEFFEVCEAAGVDRLASVSGDIDLANDDGQFLARILGAVAKKESDDKSRRISASTRSLPRREGRWRWEPPVRLRGRQEDDPRVRGFGDP